jgi:hypothetical protein
VDNLVVQYIVYCHFEYENPTCTVYAKYEEDKECSFIGNIFNVKSKQELLDFADKNYFISESDIEFID